MDYTVVTAAPDIYHHGIKGQKWGVRRFQNKDGSLTAAGKKRYDDDGPDDRRPNKSGPRETAVKVAESRIVNGKKEVSYMMTDMEKYLYENRDELATKQLKTAQKIKTGIAVMSTLVAAGWTILPVVAIHNIRKYY